MNTYKREIILGGYKTERLFIMRLTVNGVKVFDGKITVPPRTDRITVDLTHLLGACQYKGYNAITPIWANNKQAYIQPVTAKRVLEDDFSTAREIIKADWILTLTRSETGVVATELSGTTLLVNGNAPINRFYNMKVTYRNFDSEKPINHFPSNNQNLRLVLIGWFGSSSGMTRDFILVDGERVKQYTVSTGTNVLNMNFANLPIGKPLCLNDDGVEKQFGIIDTCSAPYYLVWMDYDGCITYQRFTPATEYEEEYTNNYRVASDDSQYIANGFTEGVWRLKSYNLKDDEYKYYMSMMQSPYVLLYDTERQEAKYVLPEVRSMEQKTFRNNNRKPVYFEVEVKEILPKNYFI